MELRKCFYYLNDPALDDLIFIFSNTQIHLLSNNQVPIWQEVCADLVLNDQICCFAEDTKRRYLFAMIDDAPKELYQSVTLRSAWDIFTDEQLSLARLAWHVNHWRKTHRYCGACGHENNPKISEQAFECQRCQLVVYPRISPCVIVLIHDKNRLLLARSAHFPEGIYSTVAGFVEPGETLEQALCREIKEEVGVRVKNIKYFGSQPWPFPDSLMIGFTAEYAGGDIEIDPVEIEDAQWFDISDGLPLHSSKMSISWQMIDAYLSGRI